ncbi:hypothetical protein LF41_508 [Lysobacter dokdonensis DS-58]|uniref:Uncharacterized protein n=1 Tax=Lysobacter dokdonensis DS-58 TaxID=1300345 RepID=A0A0A2WFF4_9GAMM|nr:hypothetical protein LF41_508 [Lysobacter dokdonensis DS-58]
MHAMSKCAQAPDGLNDSAAATNGRSAAPGASSIGSCAAMTHPLPRTDASPPRWRRTGACARRRNATWIRRGSGPRRSRTTSTKRRAGCGPSHRDRTPATSGTRRADASLNRSFSALRNMQGLHIRRGSLAGSQHTRGQRCFRPASSGNVDRLRGAPRPGSSPTDNPSAS